MVVLVVIWQVSIPGEIASVYHLKLGGIYVYFIYGSKSQIALTKSESAVPSSLRVCSSFLFWFHVCSSFLFWIGRRDEGASWKPRVPPTRKSPCHLHNNTYCTRDTSSYISSTACAGARREVLGHRAQRACNSQSR